MTNAEKYLKDNVSAEEFVKVVWGSCYNIPEAEGDKNYKNCMMYGVTIERWLNEQAKPTLTEDERVILRNLRYEKGAYEYTKIGRTELDSEGNCDLILIDSDNESVWWGEYGHLFQFIKERRRIRDRGVVEMIELYPLTIIKDRYNGVYSGGKYTAWNLEPEEIPTQIFYDDVSCYGFWAVNKIPVGKGNTPQEAIKNLEKLLGVIK